MKLTTHTWIEDKEGGLVAARLHVWKGELSPTTAEGTIYLEDGSEITVNISGQDGSVEGIAIKSIENALVNGFKRITDNREVW